MTLREIVMRTLFAWLLLASSAVACPFCDSETGQQVRQGIFDRNFVDNLLLTLIPFPVLLAIVVLIYFGLPPYNKERP